MADIRATDTPIPARLTVLAWLNPVVDALGFLPHDPARELTGTGVKSDRWGLDGS